MRFHNSGRTIYAFNPHALSTTYLIVRSRGCIKPPCQGIWGGCPAISDCKSRTDSAHVLPLRPTKVSSLVHCFASSLAGVHDQHGVTLKQEQCISCSPSCDISSQNYYLYLPKIYEICLEQVEPKTATPNVDPNTTACCISLKQNLLCTNLLHLFARPRLSSTARGSLALALHTTRALFFPSCCVKGHSQSAAI